MSIIKWATIFTEAVITNDKQSIHYGLELLHQDVLPSLVYRLTEQHPQAVTFLSAHSETFNWIITTFYPSI